ncbi:MAG: hypothetical protein DME65_04265 [Verrucomicrobia bacterium]|nr:MAG: hypothetical protein DME65_04265 [Verrucomicrobiota bacterium]
MKTFVRTGIDSLVTRSELFGNQRFYGARSQTDTYEQIRIIHDRSHNGSGVYRFLSATGNQRDEHDGIDDGPSFTDSGVAGTAQEHWRGKKESVKD